jgi:hypothetical protein
MYNLHTANSPARIELSDNRLIKPRKLPPSLEGVLILRLVYDDDLLRLVQE